MGKRTTPRGTDVDLVEDRAKMHEEEREAAQEADVEVAEDSATPVDETGQALLFEGFKVTMIESRLVGDLKIAGRDYVRKHDTRRIECTVSCEEVRVPTKGGKDIRIQHFYPLGPIEFVPEERFENPGEEVERKLAEAAALKNQAKRQPEEAWGETEPAEGEPQSLGDLQDQVLASARKISTRS